MRLTFLLVILALNSACLFKVGENIGSGLINGALDEVGPEAENGGINGVFNDIIEEEIVAQLGHQLGESLMSGVGTISAEQQASVEALVDGAITVAAKRAGAGIRDELSPQLRAMVRQDIINALSEGLAGPVRQSAEVTVEATVNTAMFTLRRHLRDPEMRQILGDLLRDSIYTAMREGRPGAPAVGETLQVTLSENLLKPFERSVFGLTGEAADRVDEANSQIEKTLNGIISFLVLVLGVFVLLFFLTRRQLVQERVNTSQVQRGLGDDLHILARTPSPEGPARSSDYLNPLDPNREDQ